MTKYIALPENLHNAVLAELGNLPANRVFGLLNEVNSSVQIIEIEPKEVEVEVQE